MPNYNLYSYRRLRRAIGYLGISLPITLLILSQIDFFNTSVQPSISHFYYTNLREIFTGTLCAVGLFMIRYKGLGHRVIWKNDNFLTNVAGVMAVGVALFPTAPDNSDQKIYSLVPLNTEFLGNLHYFFAASLFGVFALLSIAVFTLGSRSDARPKDTILTENLIYRTCGGLILLFAVLVPISSKYAMFPNSTLILEALMLFAFGTSWMIKGRALGDKGEWGKKVYGEENIENTESNAIQKESVQEETSKNRERGFIMKSKFASGTTDKNSNIPEVWTE